MTYDPLAFTSWTQVAALAVLALLVLGVRWIGTAKKDAAETKEQVGHLVQTMTQPNGGSSVKDQLNRVEKSLTEHITWSEGYVKDIGERIDSLEHPAGRRVLTDEPESAESPQEGSNQ